MTSVARSVLLRGHVDEPSEHGRHRVVHPDVDRAELLLAALGRSLYLIVLGDVRLGDDRSAAERLDLTARLFEPFEPARDEAHMRSAAGERVSHRATDPCRCTGDDDDFAAHDA